MSSNTEKKKKKKKHKKNKKKDTPQNNTPSQPKNTQPTKANPPTSFTLILTEPVQILPQREKNSENFDEDFEDDFDDYGDLENPEDFDEFEYFEDSDDYEAEIRYDDEMEILQKRRKDCWKFMDSVRANDLTYIKEFINQGGDVNYPSKPQGPLHWAAYHHLTDVVKLLVSAPDIIINQQDEDGDTPLHLAISNKVGKEIINILLDHGASLRIANWARKTPLDYAKLTNDKYVISGTELMEKLCDLVQRRDLPGVTKFIDSNDVCINFTNKEGLTPLHTAALYGRDEIAAFLIEKGACVRSITGDGLAAKSTPLHIAASKGHTQIAKLLIEKGTPLNAVNKEGQTALHCATAQNHSDVAKLLIESKCDVNCLNSGQLLPLHYAIMNNMMDTIKLLLTNGCRVNHPRTKTLPIIYANMMVGFPEDDVLQLVKLLVSHNAKITDKVITSFQGKLQIVDFLKDCKSYHDYKNKKS